MGKNRYFFNKSLIVEGKCSWAIIKALEKATPRQRVIIEEHYGSKKPESLEIIKKMYEDLDLQTDYAVFKENSYQNVCKRISESKTGIPRDLLYNLVNNTYKSSRTRNVHLKDLSHLL